MDKKKISDLLMAAGYARHCKSLMWGAVKSGGDVSLDGNLLIVWSPVSGCRELFFDKFKRGVKALKMPGLKTGLQRWLIWRRLTPEWLLFRDEEVLIEVTGLSDSEYIDICKSRHGIIKRVETNADGLELCPDAKVISLPKLPG